MKPRWLVLGKTQTIFWAEIKKPSSNHPQGEVNPEPGPKVNPAGKPVKQKHVS